jgi:hypothetical protein
MPDDTNKSPADPDVNGASDTTALPNCPSRPVLAVAAHDGILLLTDSGSCFRVSPGETLALQRLPDLDGCSAVVVDAAGKLYVGLYDGMIAIPRDDEWTYHATGAALLSLAATPWRLAIGDASGSVTFRDPPGSATAKAALGEPVVDLAAFDDGVVALGAQGGLWRLERPQGGIVSPEPVRSTEALGRPVGLFNTGDPSTVGAYSAERLAILIHGARRVTVGIRRFPDGIDKVVPFGSKPDKTGNPPFGVLTDAGQVWFVDANLKTVAPVVLPGESKDVVGLAPGPHGWLLAWTAAGSLIAIGRDRMVRTLAMGDVTLAFTDSDLPDRVNVVHWQPAGSVQVRRLPPEPSR